MLSEVDSHTLSGNLGKTVVFVAIVTVLLLCLTRAYTRFAYRRSVAKAGHVSTDGTLAPPVLPYWIPWVGHTFRFFEKTAMRWHHGQEQHPPSHGVYTMLIAARRTHIVINPTATRHLFRHAYTGGLSREKFVGDLLTKCLQVSNRDCLTINTGHGRKRQEEVFHKYLGRREAVMELISLFSTRLRLSYESIPHQSLENIGLYAWLRKCIISVSLTTFFGEELLQIYPGICEDIFHFDADLCSFFFGLPRALNRAAWHRRQRIVDHLVRWESLIRRSTKDESATDPSSAESWHPILGSRFNRARLELYDEFDLSPMSRAGMNLSIMFALASNVIPAIGWMMFHLIAGPDRDRLLKAVRGEIEHATTLDGVLDIAVLLSASPVLQALWTEVTRHYCDNMIMRDVTEATVIPLDERGLRRFPVTKGDLIIAPCWIAHHDANNWQQGPCAAPPDIFAPERFLGSDLPTAHASGLAGTPTAKMYPFGGGKSICAGRNFARQEALVTVAQTLLSFDFEVTEFLGSEGQPTSSFPSLTPSLPGTVIYTPQGDVSVTIRRRGSSK